MSGDIAWAVALGLMAFLNMINTALLLSMSSPWAAFTAGATVFTAWAASIHARKALR